MRRYRTLIGMILLLAACGGGSTTGPNSDFSTPTATSIELSGSEVTFDSLAATTQLTATVKDQNGATMSGATVTWTTSAASVATVSSTGLVTSVADGSASITATSGSAIASASVTVAIPPQFYLAPNGVTVICSSAVVGETGDVGGVTYTKRSRDQIDALADADNYTPLATTCTSDITDMSWLLYSEDTFNADIGSWDVSNVTDFSSMLWDATSFNQNLSGWCVSLITTEPGYFDRGADSWTLARPVWGTCP